MSHLASTHLAARILVTVRAGLVTVGIEPLALDFDPASLELVTVDFDTQGETDLTKLADGREAIVTVGQIERLDEADARLARQARDAWALS